MNVQEGVPSNDAGEDGTGAVPTAIAEAVGVAELASRLVDVTDSDALDRMLRDAHEATHVSFPRHRREVGVRGYGAETVTVPSGGK